jgi:hypothetical protein
VKVHELLSDESKWTTGAPTRDAQGRNPIQAGRGDAVRWCLLGAVWSCYGIWGEQAKQIEQKIRDHLGIVSIAGWNDAPERTFAEVRQLALDLDI